MSETKPARFGSVDRFEGDKVVLEVEGRERVVERSAVDPAAREGDVLDLVTLRVDAAETEALRKRTRELDAKAKPEGGDFSL